MNKLKQQALTEWLLLDSQSGDKQALHRLIELWYPKLLMYAKSKLNDIEAAKEVTQDSLYSIVKAINTIKDVSAFPKWAYQILMRRINDWTKQEINWRQSKAMNQMLEPNQSIHQVQNTSSTDCQALLQDCLHSLDPEVRRLLRLYYLDGLSIHDLAELLNLPTGTIKSRLFYARKKFQNILEK